MKAAGVEPPGRTRRSHSTKEDNSLLPAEQTLEKNQREHKRDPMSNPETTLEWLE